MADNYLLKHQLMIHIKNNNNKFARSLTFKTIPIELFINR